MYASSAVTFSVSEEHFEKEMLRAGERVFFEWGGPDLCRGGMKCVHMDKRHPRHSTKKECFSFY